MKSNQQLLAAGCAAALAAGQATGGLAHEWSFDNGTANDSVGNADLTLNGGASVSGGRLNLPGGGVRVDNAEATGGDLAELANTINGTDALSVVIRYRTNVAQNWSKTFMAGDGTSNYLDHTPQRGNGQGQGITLNTGTGGEVQASGLPVIGTGVDAMTIAIWDEGTDSLSLRALEEGSPGTLQTAINSMGGRDLADLSINEFYLGSAVGFGDQDFIGSLGSVQIYDHALSQVEINTLIGIQVPGDTDGDGDIDDDDLNAALSSFTGPSGTGATIAEGDFNEDGDVDVEDIMSIIAAHTGPSGAPALVPEPASAALLFAGGLLLARRRCS